MDPYAIQFTPTRRDPLNTTTAGVWCSVHQAVAEPEGCENNPVDLRQRIYALVPYPEWLPWAMRSAEMVVVTGETADGVARPTRVNV